MILLLNSPLLQILRGFVRSHCMETCTETRQPFRFQGLEKQEAEGQALHTKRNLYECLNVYLKQAHRPHRKESLQLED